MTEKSNEVLSEQIRQLRRELSDHKTDTKTKFERVDQELEKLEEALDKTQQVANEVNISMQYVKQSVDEMKSLVNGFTEMVRSQNESIDKKIERQNEKIDSFINSDKRRDSKKQFIVSILQVFAGILATVLGFWASGKI